METILDDPGYDTPLAKRSLQTIIRSSNDSPYQVNSQNSHQEFRVQTGSKNTSSGLYETLDEEDSEVVLRMQGIVTDINLAPNLLANRNISHIHQAITLTGMGEVEFEDQLKALLNLFARFSETFPDGQMQTWIPSFVDLGTSRHSSFKLSNPLVMHPNKVRESTGLKEIPINSEMDPTGQLQREKGKWMYTDDNEIQVWHITTANGQRRFEKATAGQVRVGDIVEAKFCLRVYEYGAKGYKQLRAVLKTVAILDPSIQQAATRGRIVNQYLSNTASNTDTKKKTKRSRTGYDDEDAHEREVKRMTKATEQMQLDPE